MGLVKDRQAAFATMAQPPVFSLLYILNLLPMYFLTGQGQAAQSIDVVFWAILLFVAYTRGGLIGRPWLVVFPAAGALLTVAPVSRATPVISTLAASTSFDVTTIVLALITLIQLIGIVCGLTPKPRLAEAPAE